MSPLPDANDRIAYPAPETPNLETCDYSTRSRMPGTNGRVTFHGGQTATPSKCTHRLHARRHFKARDRRFGKRETRMKRKAAQKAPPSTVAADRYGTKTATCGPDVLSSWFCRDNRYAEEVSFALYTESHPSVQRTMHAHKPVTWPSKLAPSRAMQAACASAAPPFDGLPIFANRARRHLAANTLFCRRLLGLSLRYTLQCLYHRLRPKKFRSPCAIEKIGAREDWPASRTSFFLSHCAMIPPKCFFPPCRESSTRLEAQHFSCSTGNNDGHASRQQ